jgi:hypothetical protein
MPSISQGLEEWISDMGIHLLIDGSIRSTKVWERQSHHWWLSVSFSIRVSTVQIVSVQITATSNLRNQMTWVNVVLCDRFRAIRDDFDWTFCHAYCFRFAQDLKVNTKINMRNKALLPSIDISTVLSFVDRKLSMSSNWKSLFKIAQAKLRLVGAHSIQVAIQHRNGPFRLLHHCLNLFPLSSLLSSPYRILLFRLILLWLIFHRWFLILQWRFFWWLFDWWLLNESRRLLCSGWWSLSSSWTYSKNIDCYADCTYTGMTIPPAEWAEEEYCLPQDLPLKTTSNIRKIMWGEVGCPWRQHPTSARVGCCLQGQATSPHMISEQSTTCDQDILLCTNLPYWLPWCVLWDHVRSCLHLWLHCTRNWKRKGICW